jgi:hypothetical protein
VTLYPEVTVKFIPGHNPDLVVNGETRIDLTKYNSKEELHVLFQSLGFTIISEKFRSRDKNKNCPLWKKEGQCQTNSMYMNEYCAVSCSSTKLEL